MNRLAVLALSGLALSLVACSFLTDEAEEHGDITIREEIPFDFEIDADELCDSGSALAKCDGKSTQAPAKVKLGELEKDLDIDIVEVTGRPRLREVSSRFKEITITDVEWEVSDNSLTFDTPEIDIYMGPIPVKKHDDEDAFRLTTLPPVPKGTDDSGTAPVSSAAEQKASDVLRELKMSAIPYGEPAVKKGQRLPPSGKATVSMTVKVKFVANPVGAAKK